VTPAGRTDGHRFRTGYRNIQDSTRITEVLALTGARSLRRRLFERDAHGFRWSSRQVVPCHLPALSGPDAGGNVSASVQARNTASLLRLKRVKSLGVSERLRPRVPSRKQIRPASDSAAIASATKRCRLPNHVHMNSSIRDVRILEFSQTHARGGPARFTKAWQSERAKRVYTSRARHIW
jgi:hypothetical protein